MLALRTLTLTILMLEVCALRAEETADSTVASGQQFGVNVGGSNWTTNSNAPVPGIDAASVSKITLFAGPPQGITFVVWSDLANQRSGSGGGGARDGAKFEGFHQANSGRKIEFTARSQDGLKATLSIGNKNYDLTKGSFFLVSTQRKQTVVKQLTIDPKALSTHQKEILAHSRN